jgi:phosphoribosylformylglycinamidine synthase subunit PurS
MRIRVYVTPRKGVLDPQGQAVASGLRSLGFDLVKSARVGKVIDIELKGVHDEAVALEEGRRMARELLANEIVEDFDVAVL